MPLKSVISNAPSVKWGLDFIGPINLPYSTDHIFIPIVTDYFTKSSKEFPLKKSDENEAIDFLEHSLLPRFGVPLHLVFDNGPTFISHNFSAFCEKFHIKHSFFSSYYPQGNGLVVSTNK